MAGLPRADGATRLAGCRWSATECEGSRQVRRLLLPLQFSPARLTPTATGHISPVLLLHGQLLAQVLSEYYLANNGR